MARMIGHEELLDDPQWMDPAWRAGAEQIAAFAEFTGEWMLSHTKLEIPPGVRGMPASMEVP